MSLMRPSLRPQSRFDKVVLENLHRIKTGTRSFTMPADYQTNSTIFRGWVIQRPRKVDKQSLQQTLSHLKEPLSWITDQLFQNGDVGGAVRGALLVRHLVKDSMTKPDPDLHDSYLYGAVNKWMNREHSYKYAGIDDLSDMINQKVGSTSGPDKGAGTAG